MAWRIRDRATFEALRRSPHRARRGPVTVSYVGTGDGPARVAYAVGRRVGGAVVRNQVRRRLRAIVAELEATVPGAYLLAVGPDSAAVRYPDLKQQVTDAMAAASRRRR